MRALPSWQSDDGDPLHFCTTCAFSQASKSAGYDKAALRDLHVLVEHVGPFRRGDYVFRAGNPFRAIFAVRAGAVKTVAMDPDGNEHILGFYIPGEVIGLNAIYPEHYPCDAIALETSLFCRFSFPAISALATRMPGLQQQLFKLISKELGEANRLLGSQGADERVAAFLLNLAARYAAQGSPPRQLRLAMSRNDVAAHLHLASETVSRTLTRFKDASLIDVSGRTITVLDPNRLSQIGQCILER